MLKKVMLCILHLKNALKFGNYLNFISRKSKKRGNHKALIKNMVKIKISEIKNFDFSNQPEFIKEGTGRTKMRQNHPKYAAMVETMDENVGKLIKSLKDSDLYENSLIIFNKIEFFLKITIRKNLIVYFQSFRFLNFTALHSK